MECRCRLESTIPACLLVVIRSRSSARFRKLLPSDCDYSATKSRVPRIRWGPGKPSGSIARGACCEEALTVAATVSRSDTDGHGRWQHVDPHIECVSTI